MSPDQWYHVLGYGLLNLICVGGYFDGNFTGSKVIKKALVLTKDRRQVLLADPLS